MGTRDSTTVVFCEHKKHASTPPPLLVDSGKRAWLSRTGIIITFACGTELSQGRSWVMHHWDSWQIRDQIVSLSDHGGLVHRITTSL